jgi:adenine-specific DNA-methyltransferase
MKAANEISSTKLRGGFYTPSQLVKVCYDRVKDLVGSRAPISILEPSVGDGAFIKGLIGHELSKQVHDLFGVEIIEDEAHKALSISSAVNFPVRINVASSIYWSVKTEELFDVAVGNPPFVRYQFVPKNDLLAIEALGRRIGVSFKGVSNLWIPILLGALSRLHLGGAMAFVVPAEIFTGLSAGDVRRWLLGNFSDLRIDMFLPGSFPEVLQEVVVISGAKRPYSAENNTVTFVEHGRLGEVSKWRHTIRNNTHGWTRYLLAPRHLDALEEASEATDTVFLGDIAKIEVSIVTGANDYFSVNAQEINQYNLHEWSRPLLPRIRFAEGLVYTDDDHERTVFSGVKAWLLDFDAKKPDPALQKAASEYIKIGEQQGLHTRYKTSIRTPWYRVPGVWADKLMLSKRSHWYPRLVLNKAGVLTTDTIYRGRMIGKYTGCERELVTGFHNSLTLLTAEIEGRSFGGGVLELVPSEIARLRVPFTRRLAPFIEELDSIARSSTSTFEAQNVLIEATNRRLIETVPGFSCKLFEMLEEARQLLAKRRFSRN